MNTAYFISKGCENMRKSIKYEYDSNRRQIVVLFKNGPKIEDEQSFCRTHYFVDEEKTKITTAFKDELLKLFNVDSVKELKAKIDNNIKLIFKPGDGEMIYDATTNMVVVYTNSFKENVIKPNEKTKRLRKSMEKLAKKEKISSNEFTNLISTIAEGTATIQLTEKDRKTVAQLVPQLIKDGNIKISLRDITDINKDRLKDIVQIGRDILYKKRGVEKKLGIDRKFVGKEYAWQKYFELYGTYLLFGSIKQQKPEELLQVESKLRNSDSRLDILTINRYGFLDIVELKKSEEYLFKLDKSHDNIVPTAKLSTAISQVNNYLMLLPYATEHGELIKGAESATGMLVMGSKKHLMSQENIEKYKLKTGMSENMVQLKLQKALRDLNYSYAHIQIVLYDEILDNLDNFINQMEIKI